MRGDSLGPLHGLPLGVKDLIDAKGLPTSFGSVLFADNIAAEDEAIVAMLKRAGAIVVGKTNVPEWGAGGNTRNALHGATGNPFDPERSAAGLVRRIGGGARHRHGAAGDRFGHGRLGQEPRRVLRCRRIPPLARVDRQQQPQHGLAANLAARTDGEKRIGRVPDAFLHAGSRRARSAVGDPSRRRNARECDLSQSAKAPISPACGSQRHPISDLRRRSAPSPRRSGRSSRHSDRPSAASNGPIRTAAMPTRCSAFARRRISGASP